mgnify:CR=1 FL=1
MKQRTILACVTLIFAASFGYAETRYPIVFAHGVIASAKILSFQPVAKHLRQQGFEVYVPEVSAFNSVEHRANQLAPQIDQILKISGSPRVNIIAHSMGGLDSRYLISTMKYGDRVASLSTVSTPHYGTSVTDVIFRDLKNDYPFEGKFLLGLIGSVTTVYNKSTKRSTVSVMEALQSMAPSYVRDTFNPNNPDDAQVYYQSWGAETSLDGDPDLVNPALLTSYKDIWRLEGANDGLVPVSSMPWGNFRGVLPADHLDEVGLLRKLSASPDFNYLEFYEQMAAELESKGY